MTEEYLKNIKETAIANTQALLAMADPAFMEEALQSLERMDYTAGAFTATVQGDKITSFCWELKKDESGEITAQNTETQRLVLLDTPAEEVQKTLRDAFAALP